MALYREAHPELFEEEVQIDYINFMPAVDLAHVLVQTGQQAQADLLLSATETYIAGIPRLGCCGYGLTDVEIAAIRGDVNQALIALEQAVAESWKVDWWWETDYNPNLDNLSDNERYRTIVAALAEEMAGRGAAIGAPQTE